MNAYPSVQIQAPAGAMAGTVEDGLIVFRGVPYAEPPTWQGRFAAPRPAARWNGVRACTEPGPIAPQGLSRLRGILGDFEAEQSEDCLSLTIWAPERSDAPLPVMIWLHGGAYMSGAGSLDCYSGEALARNGDVVVVAPNFRQGALGFLYLPGVSPGNLGLLDQLLALRWVAENIASFGGDASRITLFGQSSGASCIRALMTSPLAIGTFQRAILQSAALGRPDRMPELAAAIGRRFAGLLGLEPFDRSGFEQVAVERLIAAQGELARSFQVPLGTSELPFTPVIDDDVVLSDESGNWFANQAGHAMLIGYNAQEAAAGYSVDPAVMRATHAQALESLRQSAGEGAEDEYQRLTERGAKSPVDVLCAFYTDQIFGEPGIAFANRMAARGVPTWVYRFDWQSPAGLQACHCLELPFVFANLSHWGDAKMIAGADSEEFAILTAKMQGAWTAFARSGIPGHAGLPHWPVLGKNPSILLFDRVPTVCELEAAR